MWYLTRRTLLAGAAVLAGDAALAQSAPPARVKGPLVWLDPVSYTHLTLPTNREV